MEVKEALKDGRFRDTLPLELRDGVAKYLQNPNCPCNMPFFRKLLTTAKKELREYFGSDSEINEEEVKEAMPSLSQKEVPIPEYEVNHTVINCHVNDLAKQLAQLPKNTPKQIALARYQDEITCVVSEYPPPRAMKRPMLN